MQAWREVDEIPRRARRPDAEERQEGIAATLERLDADIIGLQESWATREESQAAVLAERLGVQSQWAGPSLPDLPDEPESPDYEGVDLGLALLSRWPSLDSWTRTLPSSRASPTTTSRRRASSPRSCSSSRRSSRRCRGLYASDHFAVVAEPAV